MAKKSELSTGLSFENTRPHVTVSIFDCQDRARDLAERVLQLLDRIAKTLTTVPVQVGDGNRYVTFLKPYMLDGRIAYGAWYRIEKPPSWFRHESSDDDSDEADAMVRSESPDTNLLQIVDVTNHLVILIPHRQFLGVYASQAMMRDRLNELLEFGICGDEKSAVTIDSTGKVLDREKIEQAFVRGNTRSAWLEGLHAPTVLKADRKIMSGPDLRYAIDHFGDQTFTYSAAISELVDFNPASESDNKRPFKVGISHTKYTIWTKPTRNFDQFLREFDNLLNLISKAQRDPDAIPEVERAGIPFVAHPMQTPDLAVLKDGFDVGYEPPTTADEEVLSGEIELERTPRDLWKAKGRFVVLDHAPTGGQTKPYDIFATAYYDDKELAIVRFRPVARTHFSVEILSRIESYAVPKDDLDMVALDKSLLKRNSTLTLRYSSGHVIQNGKLYPLEFRDVIFDRWLWKKFDPAHDNRKYLLSKEKPTRPNKDGVQIFDPSGIGKDSSLFSYVRNNIVHIITPDGSESADWHLLCDDGSGELADFIAFDLQKHLITFIHIKAYKDGSKDSIAVTPFSEVVNQAIKNLRYFDHGHLTEALNARTTDNNRNLVWRADGTLMNRDTFLAKLSEIHGRMQKYVIVLQPRIHRSTWSKAMADHLDRESNPNVNRMLQLSAILSTEESAFQKLDARFAVIGVDDQETLATSAASNSEITSSKGSASKKRRAKASR